MSFVLRRETVTLIRNASPMFNASSNEGNVSNAKPYLYYTYAKELHGFYAAVLQASPSDS